MTVPFADTASLRIRGYRESDLDKLVALLSDPRIIRTDPAYVVPANPSALKKEIEESATSMLMFCVLEAKAPLEDGNDWVGFMTLKKRMSPKNRNSMFGICLDAKFWGKGYGTEATRWIVHHAFEQLGMHRVSLGVIGDNPRAITLYENIGFVEEGRERKANYQDGKWWDIVSMGVLEEDWKRCTQ